MPPVLPIPPASPTFPKGPVCPGRPPLDLPFTIPLWKLLPLPEWTVCVLSHWPTNVGWPKFAVDSVSPMLTRCLVLVLASDWWNSLISKIWISKSRNKDSSKFTFAKKLYSFALWTESFGFRISISLTSTFNTFPEPSRKLEEQKIPSYQYPRHHRINSSYS